MNLKYLKKKKKKKLIVINGIKFEHGLVYKFSIYSNRTERVAEQ